MFDKIKRLNNIVNLGLNLHQFYIPETYEEYKNLISKFELCTIRTDHKYISEDLPFYIFNRQKDGEEYLDLIWDEAQGKQYRLIISDGIKYDNIQKYNMVVKLQSNGDFIFEASDLKIPLRHMYRYPSSLLSCTGNLSESIHLWHMFNKRYGINKLIVRRDLLILYNCGLFDKWLEVTKYPIPVGNRKENIVFWQIQQGKKK